MSSQANNITAIDSKKPTTKQELIAANKQDVSVGPPTCGLTVVWRAHRAARRNPLGFSLHPFPDASGPARRLRGRSHAPRGTGSSYCGTILVWPSGEIGSHSRLKICRGQPHVGSSPTSATISTASHSESISIHSFIVRSSRLGVSSCQRSSA